LLAASRDAGWSLAVAAWWKFLLAAGIVVPARWIFLVQELSTTCWNFLVGWDFCSWMVDGSFYIYVLGFCIETCWILYFVCFCI
ncbi:hypothetical protein PVAP13_4KG181905, partial [Panicum virgatum]